MNLIGMKVKRPSGDTVKIIRIDTAVIPVKEGDMPIYMALVLNDQNRLDTINLAGSLVLHEV